MSVDATGIEGAATPLLSFSGFRVDFPRGPAVRGIVEMACLDQQRKLAPLPADVRALSED